MAELIETDADRDAIRAAISADLSESNLPNDIINLPQYKDVAVAMIQRSTLAVDAFSKAAAITLCAALLVHIVPNLTAETDAGVRTEREPLDVDKIEMKLRALSGSLLALSLNLTPAEVVAATRPTFFTSASSRRGQW